MGGRSGTKGAKGFNETIVAAAIAGNDPESHESSETCELCGEKIAKIHSHLVDTEERRLLCACNDCAEAQGGGEGRYRRVPLDALPEAFR